MNDLEKKPHYFCLTATKNRNFIVAINYIGTPLFKRELNSSKMSIFKEELDYLMGKYGNTAVYSMPVNIFNIPDEIDFYKQEELK